MKNHLFATRKITSPTSFFFFTTLFLTYFYAVGEHFKSNIDEKWDFRYKGFIIGAWWSPGATDAELKLYKEAGFNTVVWSTYMKDTNDVIRALEILDYAKKYNLFVMFDTLTKNDTPWGNIPPSEPYENPTHHRATLEELKFIYQAISNHPALLGFLLGDDQGEVTPRAKACTDFLFNQPKPHLMPWLCGWIPPKNLAKNNNPISNPQIYPPLQKWHLSAESLAIEYICEYAKWKNGCKKYRLIFWPMFYVAGLPETKHKYFPSDSLIRFPAYLSIIFGAKGIWYFHYGGGSIQQNLSEPLLEEEIKSKYLTPVYEVVKEVNNRIAKWGNKIVQRECSRIFSTAFCDHSRIKKLKIFDKPGIGKLINAMSDTLIAGVLKQKDNPTLVMLIDCRVSKDWYDLPPRESTIYFSTKVKKIKILYEDNFEEISNNGVKLFLKAGEGILMEVFE